MLDPVHILKKSKMLKLMIRWHREVPAHKGQAAYLQIHFLCFKLATSIPVSSSPSLWQLFFAYVAKLCCKFVLSEVTNHIGHKFKHF